MKEFSTNGIEGMLSTKHQNSYAQLCELDDKEMKNKEIAAVGAGLSSWFDHSSKLKVMKFKEVMNWPDSSKWKKEIKNEQKQMVMNEVWEPID